MHDAGLAPGRHPKATVLEHLQHRHVVGQDLRDDLVDACVAGDGRLAGRVPAALHPLVADGYQHLDVLTAAPVQNNGRPEPVSTGLTAFARDPR